MRSCDWLQGDRGGLNFEAKTSQKPFEKRGGGKQGSGRSPGGFRGAVKESQGCYGVLGGVEGVKRCIFCSQDLSHFNKISFLSQKNEKYRFGTIKNEILVVLRIKNPYFDLFCTVGEGFGWYFETDVSPKKWTTLGMLFCPRHDSLRVLRRGSPWSQMLWNRSPICPIGVGTNNSASQSI